MASVKLRYKTDKTLSDGSHPIVIQVIHNRNRKVFYLGYSALLDQWDEEKNRPKSNHPDYKILKARITNALLEVKSVIADFENAKIQFTLEDVEKKYRKTSKDNSMFEDYCKKLIGLFKDTGKNGNAIVYQSTMESFKDFAKGKKYLLKDIDYSVVKKYQEFLMRKKTVLKDKTTVKTLTPNGISFYMRTLRAILNKAIKEGLIDESTYPFKNISIKAEKTRKRAVNKDVIKLVEDFDTSENENLEIYKDLFMFSFYNRGMNFVDIAYLKVKNVESGRLVYTRQKTGQQFSIKISDKANTIIQKYNDLRDKNSYIFPIIGRKGHEYEDYRNKMRLMNRKLKKISNLLKLDVPLTTYVSRHSWATIAKKSGISTSIISEGLGHTTEEITQVYLDSFENTVLDDANELIIN